MTIKNKNQAAEVNCIRWRAALAPSTRRATCAGSQKRVPNLRRGSV
jgi:hypothetical protein